MTKPETADEGFDSSVCSPSSPLEVLIDTGGEDVHHPYSAFNQGFDAQAKGYPKSCNPYAPGAKSERFGESWWWDLGWDEAKDQDGLIDYGSNAGIRCDTDDGPCACGAWH
jgi:hypothetical protein